MAEKREASRTVQEYEFVLSHADILDLMRDPSVNLSPADDEAFQLFIRKSNDSEISLNLRPLYEDDKIVFRYNRVELTVDDDQYTDVDVS